MSYSEVFLKVRKPLLVDEKGKVLYHYIPVIHLPQSRQLYFQAILNQIALGIDSPLLLKKIDELESILLNHTEESDLQDLKKSIFKVTTYIESRVSNLFQTDLILRALSSITVQDGESEELDLALVNQRALEWKGSLKLPFYLASALNILNNTKKWSEDLLIPFLYQEEVTNL